MRSRNLLHRSKLEAFMVWAQQRGWKREEPKGDFEIARLRKKENGKMQVVSIFYRIGTSDEPRRGSEHLTVYGRGLKLARAFVRDCQAGSEARL